MPRTRRTYTPEFKAQAVQLVTEHGYSVAAAARSLGLSENLLRNWKQTLHDQGERASGSVSSVALEGDLQSHILLDHSPDPARFRVPSTSSPRFASMDTRFSCGFRLTVVIPSEVGGRSGPDAVPAPDRWWLP